MKKEKEKTKKIKWIKGNIKKIKRKREINEKKTLERK